MNLEQFKKTSEIQEDINCMQRVIDNHYNGCYLLGGTFINSLKDKEAQEAIIVTLKEQVTRLQSKFDSIKIEFPLEKQEK